MRTFIVDAFTDTPFKGNPAGVCLVDSRLSDERMLQIAQELNLSESAFLSPLERGGTFLIRYFSPPSPVCRRVIVFPCTHPNESLLPSRT